MPETVRQIAKFLGKTLAYEEIQKICQHCSLENMRNNDMLNMSYYRKFKRVFDEIGGFINKGTIYIFHI